LVAVSDVPGTRAVYGRRFAVAPNEATIGVAAASNCVSGPMPTMSSMVDSVETVE
jgi:hypothetical protein